MKPLTVEELKQQAAALGLWVLTRREMNLIGGLPEDWVPLSERSKGVDECAPTWADLPQGCYPTITGGLTPEEYIARGRGDQSADLRAERARRTE